MAAGWRGSLRYRVPGLSFSKNKKERTVSRPLLSVYRKPPAGRVVPKKACANNEGKGVSTNAKWECGTRIPRRREYQKIIAAFKGLGIEKGFLDGIKFHNTREDYAHMREVSDRLCREYGLSVVKQPEGQSKHYAE